MSNELSLGELELKVEDIRRIIDEKLPAPRLIAGNGPVALDQQSLLTSCLNKLLAERIRKYGSHFVCDESNRLTNRGRGIGPSQEGYLVCVRKIDE